MRKASNTGRLQKMNSAIRRCSFNVKIYCGAVGGT